MENQEIHYNKKAIYLIGLFGVLALVIIDQWTKLLALRTLKQGGSIPLIEGVLELTYVENRGAAWGTFSGFTWVLAGISLVMIAFLIAYYLSLPYTKRYAVLRLLIIVMTAGAFGNLVDRIYRRYVVDFIYFRLIDFPVFNVADIYVTVSVALICILLLFYYKEEEWVNFRFPFRFFR